MTTDQVTLASQALGVPCTTYFAGLVNRVAARVGDDLVIDELKKCPILELIVRSRTDSSAFDALMKNVESVCKLKGTFWNMRLDPETAMLSAYGLVYEALDKWNGGNVYGFIGYCLRNKAIDEVKEAGLGTEGMENEDGECFTYSYEDTRQRADQTANDTVTSLVQTAIDMEKEEKLTPIEGALFGAILDGFSSIMIADAVKPAIAFVQSIAPLGITDTEMDKLRVLAISAPLSEEQRSFAMRVIRPGMTPKLLDRFTSMTQNAINLTVNRLRVKVWMTVCDKAYYRLVAADKVTFTERAITGSRCAKTNAPCRFYKNNCDNARSLASLSEKTGASVTSLPDRMTELREKIMEAGIGMSLPDYDACGYDMGFMR